jgi:hypothetical protein
MSAHYELLKTDNITTPLFVPNEVYSTSDEFYISYNDYDVAIWGSDTTALVYGQMEQFYVLDGDHREAYKNLVPQGFDACMEYFKANIHLKSKYRG